MTNSSAGLISGLTGMVHRVKSSINKKFFSFYLKRVHETELSPTKTFSYDFDIGSSSSSTHRRSLSRLKALIIKVIFKNNPVVALAAREFMPSENSNNEARLNMFEIEISSVMPEVNAKIFKAKLQENRLDDRLISAVTFNQVSNYERMARSVLQSTVQYVELDRYLKYLRYLARKNGIPVNTKIGYDLSHNQTEGSLKYQFYVCVQFVGWTPSGRASEQRLNAVLAGASDEALFGEESMWMPMDVSYMPVTTKFHIAKFFLHLDKVVKVANTLTRKIDYGYNAFSFRTA